MKKFFKKTEGFTLVELVVVIAILGILAGVGTVGYSGYIKKANMAADQVLLDSLNTAFAAACIENGVDHTTASASDISVTPGTAVGDNILTVSAPSAKASAIMTSFGTYFEGGTFKVMESLTYSNGTFIYEGTGEGANNAYSNIFTSLGDSIATSVENVKNSIFGTIGAEGLMNRVNTVTNLAADLADANGTFKQVLAVNSTGMATALGFADMSDPAFDAKFKELVYQVDPNAETDSDAYAAAANRVLANYAVLQAAQSTSQDSATLLAELQAGYDVDEIKQLMQTDVENGSSAEGLSKAAMMYAMYTAYANQMPEGEEKNQALANAGSVEGFIAHMEDEGFKTYLGNADGKAKSDLEGYLGALDIIKKSADNDKDAVADLLVNGYTDPALVTALNGLLGK